MCAAVRILFPVVLPGSGRLSGFLVGLSFLIEFLGSWIAFKEAIVTQWLCIGFVVHQTLRAYICVSFKGRVTGSADYPAHGQLIIEVKFLRFIRPPERVIHREMHDILVAVFIDGYITLFLLAHFALADSPGVELDKILPFL